MEQTIILTGGGTAGHVTPNLAIISKLEEHGFRVEYIGTKDGMERGIMAGTGIPYHIISAGKFRRYLSIRNVVDPFKILAGIFESKRILKHIRPAAVFSKGGFVSVPVVIAASHMGIPVVLHESDFTPGLANRICIPRAQKVCVSFEPTLDSIPKNKGVYTGLPLRSTLLKGNRRAGLDICGFDGTKLVLMIMGGSLGAKALNDTIDHILTELTEKFDIIHIRGRQNLLDGDLPKGYVQFGYAEKELPDLFAAADIMLSRAGATAVFEILALALPSLLVPLPRASSRGDQLHNAAYFESKGFSYVLDQADLNESTLAEALDRLYRDRERLREKMREQNVADAAESVVKVIADAAKNRT